jgi:uncharacterized protein
MRLWIDMANSPHVLIFESLVDDLRACGWDVAVTARDHAQTVDLAGQKFTDVAIFGGPSPPGRVAKAVTLARRTAALERFARSHRPDVALSHGSYAQVIAARIAGVPAVTMMDYEYQPANHVSFRLARRVIVPSVFPSVALRRFGVRPANVVRYDGFKEELYLAGFRPDPAVVAELDLDRNRPIAVVRPPPEGALYHRRPNVRFEEILGLAADQPDVQTVVLPRSPEQAARYRGRPGLTVPSAAIDALSLLAYADLMVGAGGTMNRESALLGTPTYTVFLGRLGAVDAEMLRLGLLRDLREPGTQPSFAKKDQDASTVPEERHAAIVGRIVDTLRDVGSGSVV